MQKLRRIAIVNRGEAANRCLRAIRELRYGEGYDVVGIALYADEDRSAPFVLAADESYELGPALRRTSRGDEKLVYLDIERIVEVLRQARADGVWPGWGFLAESPEFVEALRAAGITFIGPSPETMRRLGDKIASKEIASAASVPIVPWSEGALRREELEHWAARIGFPLALKATAGGGGRGIRMVQRASDLAPAFDSARAEAAAAFGDGTLFMEACVTGARHIEAQMLADQHGNVLVAGLRDCSVQRKHQKLVEEGPPPGLSDELTQAIRACSVRLLKHVGYVGVATCEYLVTSDGAFYFLEVNPRLQVEHGVTELLTGFDLVKAQIRIARGERLPEECPAERGAAIEVRLCAEDPARGFAPSPGRIALMDLPAGPGIRVDEGVAAGTNIPSEFDSMIAKILAHGETRTEARARLIRALLDTRVVVEGGVTNKGFLLDVLGKPAFVQGGVHTGWLSDESLSAEPSATVEALLVAAVQAYQDARAALRAQFFVEASRGRPRSIPESAGTAIDLVYADVFYRLQVFALGGWTYRIEYDGSACQVTLSEQGPHRRLLVTSRRRTQVLVSSSPGAIHVEIDGHLHRVLRDLGGPVRAPSPSLLIELCAEVGARVSAGDRLGVFEAMKCESVFHAPISGTVREICVRPGERLSAGEVILVIEPLAESSSSTPREALRLPHEPDPLDAFVATDGEVSLERASSLPHGELYAAIEALSAEVRRILLGYDLQQRRAEQLIELLGSPIGGASPALQAGLKQLLANLSLFADLEVLFSRTATRVQGDQLTPSNDARMAMYLRRISAEGAGIDPAFLRQLKLALRHYAIDSLKPADRLDRAVLRLYSTRTTRDLRNQLATALLKLTIRLADGGDLNNADLGESLRESLDRLWQLRGTVTPTVADLAAQARFLIFSRAEARNETLTRAEDLALTLVEPPPGTDLGRYAAPLGLTLEDARRFELWRLANFELERVHVAGFSGVIALFGRARGSPGDDRFFCLTEVPELGPLAPAEPDLSRFEQRFHAVIEAMRSIQGNAAAVRRLHWNRVTLFVRPPVVLSPEVLSSTLKRLAPESGLLGIERVVVRVAVCDAGAPEQKPRTTELIAWNPSGGRVEWYFREPHDRPLEPASAYERRVALARSRGLTYPYEVIRLFTAAPDGRGNGAQPIAEGQFAEYDLEQGRAAAVDRPPGNNTAGIVFGIITTPTRKYPEGMRRVAIFSDPTMDMGALAAPECDRIVAALELAEQERIPVEWVSVSSGARIAMDSGTENLDATARVVRKIVTFTDGGGEINVIVPGVNVGAQSYFDALATMGLDTRGILIMLPAGSMVLTGRAALEASGGVAAEDEVAMGGYERIMGPTGQAQYHARDLAEAFRLLLEHYAVSYVAPGEATPRRLQTRDSSDRDVTSFPLAGEEDYASIADLFSPTKNPGRKRPFAMRPLMRAVADNDGGVLERWRDFQDAQNAIVWDCHLGGLPITLIGMESRQIPRRGYTPNDGPASFTAATLFPHSSKKVARALNAASGNRAAVILANLSGFDGSPESMRRGVLEMGAEIARAVVRFSGKLAFVVVTRYHGGAYVVFSRELNDQLRVAALTGSYASVIGGAAAAAVVLVRDVRKRTSADERVQEVRRALSQASDPATRAALRAHYDRVHQEVLLEKQHELAREFDAVHTVERAQQVGSLECIISPEALRPTLISWLAD